MKHLISILAKGTCLFLLAVGQLHAQAFTHPCIPFTSNDLAFIKANLNREPWKSGYAILVADSHSQLTYTMQGPFATVTRNPDLNRGQWDNDMEAIWDLSRMWYFTGNNAYAQKAHDILIAWATTQTSWGGQESGLELGDYAYRYAGGADLLRATWPGWTAADTTTVQNYFLNVYWPATAAGTYVPGESNKGLLNLEAGIAIAAFCDDTAKFNFVVDSYRTYPAAGLFNTLPIGETGETGRDAGHAYGGLLGAAFISEMAWKQGMDVYGDLDNRLLAVGEYYARNTLFLDNPFVPFGTIDYTYYANAAGAYPADRAALYLIQNAYKNRHGIPTPWIDAKLQQQSLNNENWMYARTADSSTATPLAPVVRPDVSLASGGLTLTTLGNNSAGRSASYASGVWTVTGAGTDIWNDANDDCQFVYQTMTGDCALVARVTSSQWINNSTKAGLMIRDNLSATVSQRAWIAAMPTTPNQVECRQAGWTQTWGGSYWAVRDNNLPPGLPYWLKIERRGNLITTYSSPDGASWASIVSSYYGNLPSTTYIGLCTVSGSATTTTIAQFDHVAFTGGSGGLVTTPAAPAAVFASGSSQAITVRWLPSFGATSYNLLRSTTSGGGYVAVANNLPASTTSYVDTSVSAGTTYYYVAQAANSAGTSGNSPEFYGSLLPPPMANLAVAFSGGTTTASFNAGPQVGGSDTAFDSDPGSKWYCYNSPSGWIQYDFGANNAQVIKRYTINSADVPGRDPVAWSLLGSPDGTTWTTLDTQSGQSFYTPMAQNTYNIGNTTAYRYYQLNITANNGATDGVAISELGLWSDTAATPPPAPGVPSVTAQPGQNALSWSASPGATSYTVLRATSPGGPYTIIATLVSGTSYVDTNVVAGTTYYYEVDGSNSGGDGTASAGSSGTVALLPIPSAPTGVTAFATSATVNTLNWTAAANDSTYNIKRSLTSGGPYTTIASGVTATTYTDSNLTTGTTYYYVVSGVNTSGEGANSTEASATPTDLLVHLRFDEGTGTTSADATGRGWNATLVNGPTWQPGVFGDAINLASASSQYVTLPSGVVSAVNDFTLSMWVNPATLSTWARAFDFGTGTTNYMFCTVQGPAGAGRPRFAIRTPSVSEQQIDSSVAIPTGTWTQIVITHTGTTGKMYINGALVGTNTAMTLTPSSLGVTTGNFLGQSQFGSDPHLNGAIDDFRLNGHAFSTTEISAAFNPPPVTPTDLAANPADGSISLSWAVSDSATTYNVKRAATRGGPYTTIATGLSVPSYLDTGLTDGTTYFYVVSAVNRLGESANSAETSAIPHPIAWASQDIGTVAAAGSSSASGGTVTVAGSGADVWGTADAFQFRSVPVTGDCVITARVASVQNINAWSKAGVMIRGSLASTALNAFLAVTPTTTNGITWQSRTTIAGNSTNVDFPGITAPYWVRLVRQGASVAAYISPDGANWTSKGSVTLALGSTAYVGLGVTSHTDGTLCTATFDNVSVNWVPGLPGGVSATPGPMQVALSWNSVPNATSYNVYVSNVSGGPYTLLASGLTSPSYVETGLNSGATMYYFVTAANIAGEGPDSVEVSAAPILPPPAPGNLTVTGGTNQISLSWTASTGATGYNIYRSTTTGGPYGAAIGTVTGTSYVDTTAAAGTTYYYVVTATNVAGEGAVSTEANTTPLPAAATGVVAQAGNNQVALSWTAGAGAASYSVGRATVSGGPYAILASGVTATSFADSNAVNGVTYYYVITAANASGAGPASAEVSARPLPPLAAPPGGISASAGNGQVSLTWTASTYATSYNVKRATTSGGPYVTVASSTSAGFTDSSVTNGTTYYYVVSAVDLAGEGGNSAEVNAKPLPPLPAPPAGVAATAGNAQVSLSWTASTYATSYNVKRATTGGGPYVTVGSPATASFTDSSVTNGTTYYYVVTAVDLAGESGNSSEVNAKPLPPLPAAPTGLAATAGNAQVSLNWAATTYATSYTIGRATISGGPYAIVASGVATTSYVDSTVTNGTTYYYVVAAVDLAGTGPNSAEVNAKPLPPLPAPPAGVAATAGNAQVSLTWTASTYATSYNVKRATTGGGPYITVGSPATASFTDSSVTNGTTYYYVVTAVDLAGESGNSSEVNATPLPPVPATPIGLGATAGNAQVSLTWTASTYATSYNVKRATTSGGPYTTVGSPTTASFTDSSVTNGTTYYYVVTAVDLAGESANSSEVNAKPLPPLPTAPTGLAATAGNAQVSLNWAATTYATSYSVGRATISGGPYAIVASGVATTSYVDSTVTNGTTYYYVVAAVDLAGTGPNSAEVNAKPLPPVPAAPTGVAATAGSAQVSLSWSTTTYATSYNVKRSTTNGGPYTTVASPAGTSFVDTGLTNGTTYYYVVSAVDLAGEGVNSAQVSATPVVATPPAVTGLTAAAYNSEVDLIWNASTGATSYNVLRSTTSGGPYSTVASGLTTTSYIDTGLTNGTTYYYVVQAANASGTSPNSSQVSAKPVATPIVDSWQDNDIGNVGQVGTSAYSTGTFTLSGSGNGITGTADSFDYTYQALSGDGTIIARVASQGGGESGVMIRETLTAGARCTALVLQQNVGALFQSRTATGGSVATGATSASASVPLWLKLARAGNVFTAYTSPDGVTWTQLGSSITNTMATSVYVGLMQSSLTYSSLASATFTNVSIVPTFAWASQDIGAVANVGASYYSAAVATINGSGADIWGTADQFRYTYKAVSGNCTITARVTAVGNTNVWAKTGVSIRETLAAGSRHASVYVTPGSSIAFQWRATTGGSSSNTSVSGSLKAPYWVRVVRSGNTFTAYRSSNGTSWTTIGSQTITMATAVYIGLPVCSHNSSSLCTATIDNITTSP